MVPGLEDKTNLIGLQNGNSSALDMEGIEKPVPPEAATPHIGDVFQKK